MRTLATLGLLLLPLASLADKPVAIYITHPNAEKPYKLRPSFHPYTVPIRTASSTGFEVYSKHAFSKAKVKLIKLPPATVEQLVMLRAPSGLTTLKKHKTLAYEVTRKDATHLILLFRNEQVEEGISNAGFGYVFRKDGALWAYESTIPTDADTEFVGLLPDLDGDGFPEIFTAQTMVPCEGGPWARAYKVFPSTEQLASLPVASRPCN